MPKFFQSEIAAYAGDKSGFQNVKFKKRDFDNSTAAELGTVLEIIPVHIKNPPVIQFIAYLDSLSDSIQSQQTPVQPFGRTDPYYMWKSNKRSIRVGFSIPSTSISKGLDNLNNLSWFLSSLYPTYKETQVATSIAASPLFRVRYSNLICSNAKGGQGLLGVIQNVSVNHEVREGFISVQTSNLGSTFANVSSQVIEQAGFSSRFAEGNSLLIPKTMKVNFNLDVVHDHSLGWEYDTGEWRGGLASPTFPYNFGLIRETSDTPPVGPSIENDVQTPQISRPAPGSADAREKEKSEESILLDEAASERGV